MSFFKTGKSQQGLTLVELMIAMVLSLVLVAGVIQVYISNKQSYRVLEGQSRVQESARFALEFLTKDIREAGYSGCRAIEHMNVQVIANASGSGFGVGTAITGNEATTTSWSPALPASITGNVISGTDVITIQKGSSCGATVSTAQAIPAPSNIAVTVPNSCSISQNSILMIADCTDAHIFRATNNPTPLSPSGSQTIAYGISAGGSTYNLANKLCTGYSSLPRSGGCESGKEKSYGLEAEVVEFTSVTYYIRVGAGGRNALWVYDNTASTTMELVEGVEDMQVIYGIDADNNDIVDSYSVANSVADWGQVVSAEITLLLSTETANLTTAAQAISYVEDDAGTLKTVTGGDGRLRRVFTTTIGLRNRVQ